MVGFKDNIVKHSTDLIFIVMVVVTLLCPVSVVLTDAGYYHTEGYWVDLMIIAVLWAYFPAQHHIDSWNLGVTGYGFHPLNPTILFITFPIWFLNLLFAAQVIRYHTSNIPRRNVMIVGYLSLIPPTILGLYGMSFVIQWMILTYIGPIPVQFIVGYALVRFSHKLKTEAESDKEWVDEEKDEISWLKSEKDIPSIRSRIELILTNLKTHPIRSVVIIVFFIMYLPIVYQVHLNIVATKVSPSAGMYYWIFTGCRLFPIPIDYSWFFIESGAAYVRLSPLESFIYTQFYPNLFARVMWSVIWLTFGILYIISPLLKSRDKV